MKLAVEFPSVAYREGAGAVAKMAKGIEDIGYDQIDVFDHVVMGYDVDGREPSRYPAQMPILEALMMLSYLAAHTTRVGLGTEVLVLPQRQPVLVAKQISTLDTLSGGRVRLGIGVGWQASEFEALGEPGPGRSDHRRPPAHRRRLRPHPALHRGRRPARPAREHADAVRVQPGYRQRRVTCALERLSPRRRTARSRAARFTWRLLQAFRSCKTWVAAPRSGFVTRRSCCVC